MDTSIELGHVYRARIIDNALKDALESAGAVLIEGARASGKTMTAMHAASSYAFIDDPANRLVMEVAPRTLLEGEAPRLLDEWQVAPDLWNLVRRAVDSAHEPGRFILTGSAVPSDDITRHTGAGRFLRLRQRTMTWSEKLEAPISTISIRKLFAGKLPATDLNATPTLQSVIDNLLRPGFPAMTELSQEHSANRLRAYVEDVVRTDIHRLAEIRHEPEVIRHLITALARSTAREVTYRTLTADLRAVAPTISEETVSNYLDLLKRLFIIETQLPWAPELRSRARVRKSAKFHLLDPALAAAVLGASSQHLRADLQTLGLLFESAVIHDLTVIASSMGGEVRHYRDSNNKEMDAVIILPDRRWAAIEIKLGGGQVSAGVASLRKAISQIDTQAVGEPEFSLVVTGTGPVVVTDEGTITTPLRSLVS